MPIAQASHEPLGCPTTGWYRPAAQPAHAATPAAETDPAAHSLQAAVEVEPASGLNVPDLQATHAEPG